MQINAGGLGDGYNKKIIILVYPSLTNLLVASLLST